MIESVKSRKDFMQKLIDYRDETPDNKSEDVLILFRVEENKVIKNYGAWVTKDMACDVVILEPFLLTVAALIDTNPKAVNGERAFVI